MGGRQKRGASGMTEAKICARCGIEFEVGKGQASTRKYCSDACRIKSYNAKRYNEKAPEICPECGDWIEQEEGKGRYRRFCSDQCRVKYHARKTREERGKQEQPMGECPNCGRSFPKERTRRYCSVACRTEWYKKQQQREEKPQEAGTCKLCGEPLKKPGQVYCNQACYKKAMEQTLETRTCPWCGSEFTAQKRWGKQYCSRQCAVSDRNKSRGVRRGSHRIVEGEAEAWKEKLTQATRASGPKKRGKRVRLVCGDTSMYNGLDGFIAIIRYTLRYDPYDGSVYVFRDSPGSMLKYIEWDGQSFLQGKRRAQSGTYPWPPGEPGGVMEISEKEFEYLLSRSIVPFKEKK